MLFLKHWNYSNQDLVLLYLRSLCTTNRSLTLNESAKVIINSKSTSEKVIVISGGGSGHEPTHAGLVGDGLLDVAVAGNIFASPSAKQILTGIKSIKSEKGYLLIVKNYTGDILHFGLAAERAKALGIKVVLVIVADDVAVGRTKNGLVGRRGLAGTVLVHKISGAKASMGASLIEVAKISQDVADNMVTIGASLEHCSVPGRDEDEMEILKPNEIEIGMGIHNEPGVKKYSSIPNIDDLIQELLEYLLSQSDKERSYVPFVSDEQVVLLVNNLGGTSVLELNVIGSIVIQQLAENYSIFPVRVYIGAFTTALNCQGFSITLLNASRAGGDEIIELLDSPTNATGWVSSVSSIGENFKRDSAKDKFENDTEEVSPITSSVTLDAGVFELVLRGGLEKLLSKELQITLYDTVAGDGDCGETLAAGGHAILEALDDNSIDLSDMVSALNCIAMIVEEHMGGTSGGIYSIFISALAQSYMNMNRKEGPFEVSRRNLAKSLEEALLSLFIYTQARTGDRTLVDALEPFITEIGKTHDLKKAKKAAIDGAESTRKLTAKFGRASYVSENEFKKFESEGGLPDPGAIGLAALIDGLITSFEEYH
ncbi:uncharacterized protein PRCAT00002147001 [Priceomyces carsonii]|uniref:uncharacterized protein n=1 Tax=Priceomyces carsonii TaxID=28549 RepID=UPI002ED91375|nr:unnamed protein product [Priceomyces carsonii]